MSIRSQEAIACAKASLARRMADRRRELIARPLSEIWEELAAVAMDGNDPAPTVLSCGELAEPFGYLITYAGGEEQFVKRRPEVWPTNDCKITRLYEAVPAPTGQEPRIDDVDEQSYADLRASGGIFPEFYAAAASAQPVAWQVEWKEGGEPVRQFYPDEEAARRVKSNVEAYVVGVTDPAKLAPLYAAPVQSSAAMTASAEPVAWVRVWPDGECSLERAHKGAHRGEKPQECEGTQLVAVRPIPHSMREIMQPSLDLQKIADVIEPHWRGAGLNLTSQWVIDEFCNLGDRLDAALSVPAPIEAGWRDTLRNVRAAIMEADPAVLCCTLWMPNRISPAETVVDYIDAALARHQGEGGGPRS